MPNPYNSLEELFLGLFEEHIAVSVATILENEAEILSNQQAAKASDAAIAADLLAVKEYLGMTGPLPLSLADQEALAAVNKSTLALKTMIEGISTAEPKEQTP